MGQDEIFSRRLAQGLRCMLRLRSEQRFLVLCADLSDDRIVESWEQIGKTQVHTPSQLKIVPW